MTVSRTCTLFATGVSAGICLASGAYGTTISPMTLDELARASAEAIHGTVTSSQSRWNDDRTIIVTDVKVQVHESLMGSSQTEIQFVHPGGVVGALRVEIPGVGAFRRGQEVVLFLAQAEGGRRLVTGLTQGRFDVLTDAETGVKRVVSPALSVPAEEGETRSNAAKFVRRDEPLADFLARIRGVIEIVERTRSRE